MTAQAVTVRKVLPASCEEIFDAWLDPEGMSRWMMPGPVTGCEVMLEPHVGGRFRIVMKASDEEFVHTGELHVLERPSKLKFTWVSSRWNYEETLVTVELYPRGENCELVLTHERFPHDRSAEELTAGWGQIIEKLGKHLAR